MIPPLPRSVVAACRVLVTIAAVIAVVAIAGCADACAPPPHGELTDGVAPDSHPYFPIDDGAVHAFGRATDDVEAITCTTCHTNRGTFVQFNCVRCHEHEQGAIDLLHSATNGYAYTSTDCFACHASGVQDPPFSHAVGQNQCATCHNEGAAFHALPVDGFTHPPRGAADCSSCHLSTTDWRDVTGAPSGAFDPAQNIEVSALLPLYAGTSIAAVTPSLQTLSMPMNHGSPDVDPSLLTTCTACHADTTSFYPGRLHASLETLLAGSPTGCASCHATSVPTGFVGDLATAPPRDPATGEMKHDAVIWADDAPTATALVTQDCLLCHQPPTTARPSTWASAASFHASLDDGGVAQPASCLDCHANSRPQTVLTASTSSLAAGIAFDHQDATAQGECTACHAASLSAPQPEPQPQPSLSWSGGRFHLADAPTPQSCNACHEGQRPTSTADWGDPDYERAPFDFVTNAAGLTHGAGQDCVTCHTSTQAWQGGHFEHGADTPSSTTCIACHSTQRPDLVVANAATLLGFDHVDNGSGDCIGCHQASVVAARYESFFNAAGSLPGGDWQGGVAYPGSFPIAGADDVVTVAELALVTNARGFVTGASPTSEALPQAMVHTATVLPAQLQAGTGPDETVCWHCHTNNNGVVTQTVGGVFHDAFANFRATPNGALSPLPQPQTGCKQCHVAPAAARITLGASSTLQPMDHGVVFSAPVTIDGASVGGVGAMECATCHKDPGGSWSGGTFHDKVASASLPDCVRCHFPTMADGALADVVDNPDYVMKHRSTQVGEQRCDTCHTGALALAVTRPSATQPSAEMWAGASLHDHVPAQPTVCVECHAATSPSTLTQGSERYVLAEGASATNEAAWMSHRSTTVASQDCARCHAADTTAGTWSTSTPYHARVTGVATVTTCRECHGTGAPGGAQNNLPVGLTSSRTVTSASTSTGVPSGTRDQITHADANVTRHDCNFCHTQNGPSTTTGVTGKEWAQASFHTRFSAGDPLIANGTTARCSSCHLNVKPGPGYVVDHAAFTAISGSVDCAACHAWPGTGSSSSPNWQGATGGAPATMAVGGFAVPQPPATNASTFAPSIPNLPHPTVSSGTSCATCHDGGTAGRNAFSYDHAPAQIAGKCSACHEAGSDLVRPTWNAATTLEAGAGDSRPISIASFVATTPAYPGRSLTVDGTNHFFPTDCNECHAAVPNVVVATTTGAAYRAAWGFPHDQTKMSSPSTCVQCHSNNLAPLDLVDDPLAARDVTALVPTFAGTTIASLSPSLQTLPMPMDHSATSFDAAATTSCGNCHTDAVNFYPGAFHSSLANLALPNPDRCVECHVPSAPVGFVGPLATDPVRTPSSGEMRHDAVAWLVDRPTATGLVPQECALCHVAPSEALAATWATPPSTGSTPLFHDSLDAAALPQPDSCLDCHANSRANATYTTATAPTLPPGVSFDHAQPAALVDCVSCHANTSTSSFAGGRFHRIGDANPTSCLPCHGGERPTSTATWTSTTFRAAPFDFVTNAQGVGHGADRDCVECHAGPGTRGAQAAAWGENQTWEGGVFDHAASPLTDTTCILCHSTQRADRVLANAATLLGFDHATAGTGDCIGCHQATVTANRYTRLFNAQGSFPGGDWQGGVEYPGSSLITAPNAFVRLTEVALVKTGNRVTGTTSTTATLPNAMLHTSTTITNPELQAGPTGSPNPTTCWHCHTSSGTTVTSFANGQFHDALTTFRATPGGAVTAQAQPTSCLDCHAQMRPQNIVSTPSLTLQPMDHAALFLAPTTIGGRNVTGVAQMECAQCHVDAGGVWSDGRFHSKIGTATPADCVQCHYPLMATPALADKTSGTTYAMKHGSTQVLTQACNTCHTAALSRSTQAPVATLWNDGTLHPHTTPQPTSCNECHVVSRPPTTTQGTNNWTFTAASASSGTNAGQWMSHTPPTVTSRDCAACHAADARTNGSAWSKTAPFHAVVTNATTCRECHGLTNGNGSVVGTRNNMPVGLTNSQTTSSVAGVANTGVPAGTKDQLVHTDVNVSGRDCNFCHTQAGASTTTGIAGREWSQADFHVRFNAANPLLMNGTTARCSSCHLNVKPGTAYPVNHSTFTSTSGSTDCASCHSWPGTGTASAPNWKGAVGGAPATLTVGGFLISQPPAANATTTQAGITGLPHPTSTNCVACHANGAGGKNAIGYDHASTVANNHCNACHEAGSNLLSPVWNGATTLAAGAGDTRPFTVATMDLNAPSTGKPPCRNRPTSQHFYPVDCYQCHNAPTGIVTGKTGAAYTSAWSFPHRENRMTNPSTCNLCHVEPQCPK